MFGLVYIVLFKFANVVVSVTPFFNWVHRWNTGAAFSILANAGGWQRYFFIGITVLISIFLIKLIRENRHKGETIAYSLILGGALGNLIDRIFRGYVVDSFDFYWRDLHWPAFNLADIAIVIGAFILVSGSLFDKENTNSEPDGSD